MGTKIKKEPCLVTPDKVKERIVGKDNWQRTVYDVLCPEQVDCAHLLMGETINPSGNWSSYPPHKHDCDNLPTEAKLEEIYFFQVNPEQGFGFQRIYTHGDSVDETFTVTHNTLVVIPQGYHPVVAAPGYQLYYLWVLAGEKRVLQPCDDPNHCWIKK